jgi:non-lysosomal glucosylceramidase
LDLDSDEVFADQLLADSYCRMLGLRPICPNEVRSTALQTILTACYRTNSPNIGAANLVRKDGSPMEWHNFQAHDVWIGVQYSLATALLQSKMIIEARDLLASMYRNLYIEARIPFAAPEGFNGTCRFELQDAQKLGASNPATIIQALTEQQALLEDGRIHPNLPRTFENFSKKYETILQQFRTQNVDSLQLFNALHATALKYTAGRYFRPGMIFSLTHA